MKRIIIPAIAMMVWCGAGKAQASQRMTQKGITTAAVKFISNDQAAKTTNSVNQVADILYTSSSVHVAIHRKHHRKARHPGIKKQ